MKCKNQRAVPCATCPFRKTTPAGELGGGSVATYIGQANGPFFLPCHEAEGYRPDNNFEREQCAGAAIFRANCGRNQGSLLQLPASAQHAFGSFAEFVAHHKNLHLADAEAWLLANKPSYLTMVEFTVAYRKNGIKLVPKGEAV